MKPNSEIGDPLVALAQPDSILDRRTFADKHKLKEGDRLPLFTSQGKKDFTVRGVFRPAGLGEVFGGQIAVMDVFNAQFVFGRGRNFDRIDLMNEPEVTVEELQRRLRERLPAGLEIERPSSRGQGLESVPSQRQKPPTKSASGYDVSGEKRAVLPSTSARGRMRSGTPSAVRSGPILTVNPTAAVGNIRSTSTVRHPAVCMHASSLFTSR